MSLPPTLQDLLNSPLGGYIANLAADLTLNLLRFAGAPLYKKLRPDPQQTALRQAVTRALAAAFLDFADQPDLFKHYTGLFKEWAERDEVARQLAQLIDARPDAELDIPLLRAEFTAAGYDPARLGAGVDFADRARRFAAAFFDHAAADPRLRDAIEIQLLRGMLERLAALDAAAGRGADAAEATQRLLQEERDRPIALRAYLASLISQCEAVDIAALDETLAAERESPLQLSDVYTALYVQRHGRRLTRAPRQSVHAAIFSTSDSGRDEERQPISAVAALGALPRAVVLGYPGGGKSTLVNYLAARLARRRLGQVAPLDGWPDDAAPLPVRIILRRFAAWLPEQAPPDTAGLVWGYLEKLLTDLGCPDAFPVVQRILRTDGGLVLFDGLDEVRESDLERKRSLLTDTILAFAQPLERCRVVVTCREYAYRPGQTWRLPERDFPVIELALFEQPQIRAFTAAWYGEIGPRLKGWSREESAAQADHLARTVIGAPHLYELGQYPLLLTLMAQVHGRDGTLPDDRADLYDRAVNLLLSHWESRVERESGRQPLPGLIAQLGVRRELLRSALARVALAAHERQEAARDRDERAADVPRAALWDILAAELGSLDRAKQVTDYIQERAGLLQARDHFTYTFPHRSFQEFLAAVSLWEQANPEEQLRDRVRRDPVWWREVFLLAAGMKRATPSSVAGLVETLVPARDARPVAPAPVLWAQLAAAALADTGFRRHVAREADDPYPGRFTTTYRRVADWLETALTAAATLQPPARAAAGGALSRLGDERRGVGLRDGLPDIVWGYVPPGPFWLGSDRSDPDSRDDERPADWVDIPYGYWIARYPVTTAQFRAFVEATGHRPSDPDSLRGRANEPVVWVNWDEAVAFCAWLTTAWRARYGLPNGYAITLPNEPEWEKAARGGRRVPVEPLLRRPEDGLALPADPPQRERDAPRRRYPWGNQPDPNRANYDAAGINGLSPVGAFPGGLTPYGALDMSGNVFEWTRSLYWPYPYDPRDGREEMSSRDWRVRRGGSWRSRANWARCACRDWDFPDPGNGRVGFRVVVSPFIFTSVR